MKHQDQYHQTAFRQIDAFLTENAEQIGSVKEWKGKKLLDATIAAFQAHGMDQSTSRLEIEGQAAVKQVLEMELKKEHLLPIASFARAELRGLPDYATLTRSTIRLKGPALVLAARAVAAAAQPYTQALVDGGFPADALTQLVAVADKLEATMDGKATLKVRRVRATTGLSEVTRQGKRAVRMLSAVIERRFAKDTTFLSAWRSAKRVVLKPGVPRGSATGSDAPNAGAGV